MQFFRNLLSFKTVFWITSACVLVLSLLPGEQIPKIFNFWDKAQHALGFATLCLMGLRSYPQHSKTIVMSLLVFGAAIEFMQAATTWRYGDVLDWVADAVGVSIGAMANLLATRISRAYVRN